MIFFLFVSLTTRWIAKPHADDWQVSAVWDYWNHFSVGV